SVTSGDAMASALMGDFSAAATGNAGGHITEISGGASELATAGANGAANTSADLTFAGTMTGTQTISINAVDDSGQQHGLTVNLGVANGGALTGATGVLNAINTALQKSDDSTLQQITAVQTGSTASSTFNFVS